MKTVSPTRIGRFSIEQSLLQLGLAIAVQTAIYSNRADAQRSSAGLLEVRLAMPCTTFDLSIALSAGLYRAQGSYHRLLCALMRREMFNSRKELSKQEKSKNCKSKFHIPLVTTMT